MTYSQAAVEEFERTIQSLDIVRLKIVEAYLLREYRHPRGREFAVEGFGRRLTLMSECILNVFEAIPPNFQGLPKEKRLSNVQINLQAFVFNTFGAIDNLAWVWNYEKLGGAGKPLLPPKQVGLRKNNEKLRGLLSEKFATRLAEFDKWFEHLEDLRHSLAHRIPLYVPPYRVPTDKIAAYQALGVARNEALFKGLIDEHKRLKKEREALVSFEPVMMHSYEERVIPRLFHSQILADFKTVEEIGWKMLDELHD